MSDQYQFKDENAASAASTQTDITEPGTCPTCQLPETDVAQEHPLPPLQLTVVIAAVMTIVPLLLFLAGCVVMFVVYCFQPASFEDSSVVLTTFIFPVPFLALVLLEVCAVRNRSLPCSLVVGALAILLAVSVGVFLYDPAALLEQAAEVKKDGASEPLALGSSGVGACIAIIVYMLFIGAAHLRWWFFLSRQSRSATQ